MSRSLFWVKTHEGIARCEHQPMLGGKRNEGSQLVLRKEASHGCFTGHTPEGLNGSHSDHKRVVPSPQAVVQHLGHALGLACVTYCLDT